jgi:DNA-binding IclR family transcriptional regulator
MGLIQSVDKALRLLQALDAHGGWMGVRELARTVGMTPPTTHNLLKTLQAKSFVEANTETKQYRLGLAAIRMGEGSDPLNSMRDFCRPYIEALANEFDETVIVLTWRDEQALVVDWIQADHPLSVTHNHGVIEHPIIFASGRVLLAFQSRAMQLRYAAREDLSRLSPNSPVTVDDMTTLLDQIAREGFAITKNVLNSGIAAVAAPVFDANRQAILAVGCSAPISRSTDAQISAVLARLRETAALMTQKLNGSAPSPKESTAA